MNKIDGVEILVFDSPIALANWITQNVPNPIRQEQLMIQALEFKRMYKTHYQLTVELPSVN